MKLTIPSFFRRKKNTCEKCHWIFIGNGYAFGTIKAAFFECKECKTIYWETRWMKPKYNHLLILDAQMKMGKEETLILKDVLYTEKRDGILNTARTAEKKLK